MYDDLERPPLRTLALQRALGPDGWRVEVLATTGNGTTVADARRFGMEWAAELRQQNIQAVILTAT